MFNKACPSLPEYIGLPDGPLNMDIPVVVSVKGPNQSMISLLLSECLPELKSFEA